MPQVTLSVPQEKLPILNDFINALGIEETTLPSMFDESTIKEANTETESISAFLKTYFGWEYFCNELEFE
jgi:hypothetical protein